MRVKTESTGEPRGSTESTAVLRPTELRDSSLLVDDSVLEDIVDAWCVWYGAVAPPLSFDKRTSGKSTAELNGSVLVDILGDGSDSVSVDIVWNDILSVNIAWNDILLVEIDCRDSLSARLSWICPTTR